LSRINRSRSCVTHLGSVNRPTGTPSQALIVALGRFILMLVVNWSALVGAIGTKAFIAVIIFITITGATFADQPNVIIMILILAVIGIGAANGCYRKTRQTQRGADCLQLRAEKCNSLSRMSLVAKNVRYARSQTTCSYILGYNVRKLIRDTSYYSKY
jgi:hypothetical protein